MFELTRAKNEVSGRDLIAERLADLRDAEGNLLPRGLLDVQEVDVDALRRLGTEVHHGRAILDGPHERLEHEVEEAWLGQLAVGMLSRLLAGLSRTLRVTDLVGAETRLARLAVHERIGEPGDVTARFPHLRVHEDCRVEPLDVVPGPDHRIPPAIFQVLLQLDA